MTTLEKAMAVFMNIDSKAICSVSDMEQAYEQDYLAYVEQGDLAFTFSEWLQEITTNGDYVAI